METVVNSIKNIAGKIRSGLVESRTVNSQRKQFVIVVMDLSGSVEKWIQEICRAIQEFWDILSLPSARDGYRCSLITYNEKATLVQGFAPASTLASRRMQYNAEGQTNISEALKLAADTVRNVQRDPNLKYDEEIVCFMTTDGAHNTNTPGNDPDPGVYAQQLKDMGVTLVCVAVGDQCDEAAMKKWATSEQHFARLSSGTELRAYLIDAGTTLLTTHLAGVDAKNAMALVKTGKE
jgi:Mg-chelatase subunit ChlD